MSKILLLHGAIGSKQQLEPLKEILSKEYQVYTMSFVAHGERSETKQIFSIPLFAEDVLTFLEKNKIPKTHVFGYSMGGYVALYLAKYHPEKIDKITTLGTKFYWNSEIAMKESKMLDVDTILLKVPQFAKVLEKRHTGSDWKTVLEKTKGLLIQLGKQNTLKLSDYKGIEHSVNIVLAENDNMVTEEESKNVADQLVNGSFHILPNSSHPIEKVDLDKLLKYITF